MGSPQASLRRQACQGKGTPSRKLPSVTGEEDKYRKMAHMMTARTALRVHCPLLAARMLLVLLLLLLLSKHSFEELELRICKV